MGTNPPHSCPYPLSQQVFTRPTPAQILITKTRAQPDPWLWVKPAPTCGAAAVVAASDTGAPAVSDNRRHAAVARTANKLLSRYVQNV